MLVCKDPTKVQLNITLTAWRPHFTRWVAQALNEVSQMSSVMQRGWEESGMAEGMRLACKGTGSDEFQTAMQMEKDGTLFEKYTTKKASELAEKHLAAQQARFFADGDLHNDAVTACIEHGPAGVVTTCRADPVSSAEPEEGFTWHTLEYAAAMATIQHHVASTQSLQFVNETGQQATNKKQRKKNS